MWLAAGLMALVVFLPLAGFIVSFPPGPVREILREGCVITGWGRDVAAARSPALRLVSMVDERRQIVRLLDAPVSVRYAP